MHSFHSKWFGVVRFGDKCESFLLVPKRELMKDEKTSILRITFMHPLFTFISRRTHASIIQ